jgi:ABC-type nitrate/sulfonate/bicarbonate transport system permease component
LRANGWNRFLKSPKWVTVVWVLGLIVVWEIGATVVAGVKRTPENVLPHLYQIIGSVFSAQKVNGTQTATQIVLSNAWITLMRAGIGFGLGALAGFLLALLMSRFSAVEKMIFPYLMMIQMIPILGMAPIVLAITKDIDKSRIVIAAILTFYPVATNTLSGFKAVEKEKRELMYSLAASRYDIYRKLLIPSSIPYLFAGLKIAAPMAITASILVDTLQGGGGLGCMMSQSLKHAMTIYVFWQIVFLSAIIGILSYQLMAWLERWVSPYQRNLNPAGAGSRKGATL